MLSLVMAVPAAAETVFSYPVDEHPQRQEQLAALADAMSATTRIEGSFTQTKHLQILAQPLVSKGQFALDAQGQFSWEIQQPFAQAYHYHDGDLTRTVDGERERIAPADEPSLHGFFQFFSALLQLTDADLDGHFIRYFRALDADHWQLGLRPKDRRMARVLEHLIVEGRGQRIDMVRLLEPGGDSTDLSFDYQREASPDTGVAP